MEAMPVRSRTRERIAIGFLKNLAWELQEGLDVVQRLSVSLESTRIFVLSMFQTSLSRYPRSVVSPQVEAGRQSDGAKTGKPRYTPASQDYNCTFVAIGKSEPRTNPPRSSTQYLR